MDSIVDGEEQIFPKVQGKRSDLTSAQSAEVKGKESRDKIVDYVEPEIKKENKGKNQHTKSAGEDSSQANTLKKYPYS